MTDTMATTPTTTPVEYLSTREYAERSGTHIRTVKRWLADRLLPGVYQKESGEWMIPADAKRMPKDPSPGDVMLHLGGRPAAAQLEQSWTPPAAHHQTLDQVIANLDTLLDLEQAYTVLNHGRPEDDPIVTRNYLHSDEAMAELGIIKMGRKRLMPLATIKRLRGMTS